MEDKLFELLGLGVPFYLAAATYFVFSWLDNNASDEATKIISSWLHGRSHNKPDLGNLIIKAFDRIYTSPLLRFRAFRRSAVISSIIWVLVFLIPWVWTYFAILNQALYSLYVRDIVVNLTVVVLTDYVSLLFVRRFLGAAQKRPIGASLLSMMVGSVAVVIGTFVFNLVLTITYLLQSSNFIASLRDIDVIGLVLASWNVNYLYFPSLITGVAPAFIIHLWLPLFALSSLAVRLVYLLFRAVEWAQWFLKQGDAHPFKAIGVVATIIVFGTAMLVKEAWTVL
jgi:hypothetical protein